MRSEYTHVIKEALEAVNYVNEEDNNRFRAAVQDLSNEYPEEAKFFLRNADDRFLQICRPTMNGDSAQLEMRIKQAAQHIATEYWISEGLANEFAGIVTRAFFVYQKEKAPPDNTPKEASTFIDNSMMGRLSTISEGEVIEDEVKKTADKELVSDDFAQKTIETDEEVKEDKTDADDKGNIITGQVKSEPKKKRDKKRWIVGGAVLLIVGICISCVPLIFSGYESESEDDSIYPYDTRADESEDDSIYPYDTRADESEDDSSSFSNEIIASTDVLVLPNIGDSETIDIGDTDLAAIDGSISLNYDDTIIEAAWEDLDDPDNWNVVITRVEEGETELEIYAEDDEDVASAFISIYE